MTKNLDKDGFCSIVDNYQLFYIDLWGVIHNGINLHKEAIKVLNEISNKGKEYILLTNAPRPNDVVKSFLEKMGMDKEIRDHVFTSGQASLNYLKKNQSTQKFFHIGPPRDFDLFNDFIKMKSDNINDSDYILFFGLIRKYKGLDLAIQAMSHPKLKDRKLKLLIAGEFYDDKNGYLQLIKELKLNNIN